MMTEDLAARIAETTAFIEAQVAVDETAASAALGDLEADMLTWDSFVQGGWKASGLQADDDLFDHLDRCDPARALRRVKAVRDMVAAVLAEQHEYNPSDGYYSCSQAQEGQGLIGGPTGEPGSGCSDPERAGKPCDCGRDQRVARLLGIIASEWREDE